MGLRLTIKLDDRTSVSLKKFYGYVPYEDVKQSFKYLIDADFLKNEVDYYCCLSGTDISVLYSYAPELSIEKQREEIFKDLYKFIFCSGDFVELDRDMNAFEFRHFVKLYIRDWLNHFKEGEEKTSVLIDLKNDLNTYIFIHACDDNKEVYWG